MEPGIDLTGKLIIKMRLGDDIRRILITNEDITYDELVLMMQRVYRGKLSSTDDIVIKYKDDDNDLITIFDSSDLNFAIQCSRILKITLFVNGKPEPLQSDEVKMVKAELREIRDRCVSLLDKLDDHPASTSPRPPSISTSTVVDSSTHRGSTKGAVDSPRRTPTHPSGVSARPPGTGSKEFDPLSSQRSAEDQHKVMSSFGIPATDVQERSGTPDSISSVGSASTRPVPGAQPSTPSQQGPAAAGYGQAGQKVPPWQTPQNQPAPSPYSQASQEFSPVVMRSMYIPTAISAGQNVLAGGRDSPKSFISYQQHQRVLMQSHMYSRHETDPEHPYNQNKQAPTQPMPPSFTPVSSPHAQQGAGYSGQQQQPGVVSQQVQPQPGVAAPQPGQQPGYLPQGSAGASPVPVQQQPGMGAPQSTQYNAGMMQPGQQPYPSYSQPGAPVSGQPAQPASQASYPAQQQMAGQPAFSGYQQQQPVQQPGQAVDPNQPPMASTGGNPYARQGPGYTGGYPRPTGNYPRGYQ